MKKFDSIRCLLFGLCIVLVLSLTGCAGGKLHESTGEYFDDVALTSKVKTSILGDAKVKFLQIHVETFKGVVQLSGFVDSQASADQAVHLARTVKGVKQVNNSLIVK
ncbi:BON domain-containing protein [Methylomicrobium sp. Wu6]|uniref:BON domain-containing protein n=1 Tax=Methylomicrobium sp. Wu6 TaxID=3107928 RepID=UPI002DD6A4D9|nr:BON domain-containing protein [Methylomicrobium sp. Wu6]MEC4749259.1 BON domain-containing protein [Methylomicrobium sp. Wu6]